jgi:RHS repeat-associated protein
MRDVSGRVVWGAAGRRGDRPVRVDPGGSTGWRRRLGWNLDEYGDLAEGGQRQPIQPRHHEQLWSDLRNPWPDLPGTRGLLERCGRQRLQLYLHLDRRDGWLDMSTLCIELGPRVESVRPTDRIAGTSGSRTTMRTLKKPLLAFGLLLAGAAHATGTVTYVYTDPQGTPLAEANASGAITATYGYAPYGSQVLGSPPSGPGYTGHVNDPDTVLVYMQARYYDPAVERFISTDPVGLGAGDLFKFNRFDYVNNNPVIGVYPDGGTSEKGDQVAEREIKFKENMSKAESGSIVSKSPGAAAFMPIGNGYHATETGGRIAGTLLSIIAPRASNEMKRASNPTTIPPELAHQMFMGEAQGGAVAVGGGLIVAGGVEAAPALAEGAAIAGRAALQNGPKVLMRACLLIACKESPNDLPTNLWRTFNIFKKMLIMPRRRPWIYTRP